MSPFNLINFVAMIITFVPVKLVSPILSPFGPSVVLVFKALAGDLEAIEMLGKFDLDLPDGEDDPILPLPNSI